MKKIILALLLLFPLVYLDAQEKKNLAELLGYPKDSKLLIIHADDMGLAHSVNIACFKAFENNAVTSGSMMMPCPWILEMTDYVKKHPGLDVGIHLTLTSEWDFYKWGGISSTDKISSLLDKNGNFFASVEELGKQALGPDAELELKSQIDRAIDMGIQPTHLDTHMGSVLANGELIKIYLKLSDEYKLPVLFPRSLLGWLPPAVSKVLASKVYLLDNLFMLDPKMINGNWINPYKKAIETLKPGLNEIIVHLAYNNDEMKAICLGHDDYGSSWRQQDLDLVTSDEFKALLQANHIILIGWKQIKDLMN